MQEKNIYSYRREGDEYNILINEQKLCTPKGTEVKTCNEELAQRLVKDAIATSGNYTSGKSLLCYHFSTCEMNRMIAEGSESRQDHYKRACEDPNYRDYLVDYLGSDPFLMLGSKSPVWQSVAVYLVDNMFPFINELPPHRYMAFQVVNVEFDSIVLPYYLVTDIIEKEGDREKFIEDFLDELSSFYQEKEVDGFKRDSMRKYIQNFVFYYSLEKV